MRKMTRMECNKEARRTLNRHGVDLSYCQFACYGNEIRLTGWLCKTDSSDFTGPLIEAIIHDFKKSLPGFMIFGEFDNWSFTSERIQYLGERKEVAGGEVLEQEVYEIDLDEYDFEAS
jgi:hypothetical protein